MAEGFDVRQFTRHRPGSQEDFSLYAAAILAAQRLLGRQTMHEHALDKLEALSELLKARDPHDGISLAKDWLRELKIDTVDVEPLQKMSSAIARQVDTDHAKSTLAVALGVLEVLFGSRHLGMSMPLSLASAIVEMMDMSSSERAACLFANSAGIALIAAQSNEVSFYAAEPGVAMVAALLGLATNAKLIVDRRDPASGAYLGTRRYGHGGPLDGHSFDHLVSMPPFGAVYDFGADGGRRAVEALQFEAFRKAWSQSFRTIVPDGFLSRSAASDIQLRRTFAEKGVIVTSLPAGTWGRSSGLQTSLLEVVSGSAKQAVFVDGRTIGEARGRPTSAELDHHLSTLPYIHEQPARSADVSLEALAAHQFNLSVDRYVKSAVVQQMEAGLQSRSTVTLGQLAEIVRPQAARPLRDDDTTEAIDALEVTTGDIDEGILLQPARHVRFSKHDRDRLLKSAVKPGDLIMTVKGKTGVVGHVPDSAPTDPSEMPWVISQSFAIVRVDEHAPKATSRILGAMLSAPWAQEKLQALAGGSTVPMISMGDLRTFTLPILNAVDEDRVVAELKSVEVMRAQVAELRSQIQKKREEIWQALWGLPANSGEHVDA